MFREVCRLRSERPSAASAPALPYQWQRCGTASDVVASPSTPAIQCLFCQWPSIPGMCTSSGTRHLIRDMVVFIQGFSPAVLFRTSFYYSRHLHLIQDTWFSVVALCGTFCFIQGVASSLKTPVSHQLFYSGHGCFYSEHRHFVQSPWVSAAVLFRTIFFIQDICILFRIHGSRRTVSSGLRVRLFRTSGGSRNCFLRLTASFHVVIFDVCMQGVGYGATVIRVWSVDQAVSIAVAALQAATSIVSCLVGVAPRWFHVCRSCSRRVERFTPPQRLIFYLFWIETF